MTTEVRWITVCGDCGVGWGPDDAPGCDDETHAHVPWESHIHRTPVVLPDGTTVTAVSFARDDPYARDGGPPDFGLYLDERWSPPWPHEHVDWPDFGVPADPPAFVVALQAALERARAGEQVELGCLGAHGRTGTALACLATLVGLPAADAVAWVRSEYCAKAVETPEQEAFVVSLP